MASPSDIAFSPTVKSVQQRLGSRAHFEAAELEHPWPTAIRDDLAAFIAQRDSFYFATANAAGQPYIQHRGGPPGFLRVLDEKTLGFADLHGNRQYITIANLQDNAQTFIFLMDYPRQQRVKIWGTAKVVEDDAALIERLSQGLTLRRPPSRAIVFTVATWDINCRQHIAARYSEDEIRPAIEKLQARILELEAENEALKRHLGKS